MSAGSACALSLAELERHDPTAPNHSGERRFLCPLPACAEKQNTGRHRSLVVNMTTGAWTCHRCHAQGLLTEHYRERPPISRRARGRERLSRITSLPPTKQAHKSACDAAGPAQGKPSPSVPLETAWRDELLGLRPLADSPGAEYLAARGIPLELAHNAGARFVAAFYHRPAVVFPMRDLNGRLVAVQGRYVDGRTDPKVRSGGKIGDGIFRTPGALEADPVILSEAPIDALSLAAAGYPALALGGLALRPWLPKALSWRRILVAFDADDAGDAGAAEWTLALRYGTRCERLRPADAKDWNQALMDGGIEAFRERLRAMIALSAPPGAGSCPTCGEPTAGPGVFCDAHDPFR